MSLIFLSEHWKFYVNTKKSTKWRKKVAAFLGNLIGIGNGKLSLLLLEYSSTSSSEIYDLTKNNFF